MSRTGLLLFYHDALRQAVIRRYLATPAALRRAHNDVAEYFLDVRLRRVGVRVCVAMALLCVLVRTFYVRARDGVRVG